MADSRALTSIVLLISAGLVVTQTSAASIKHHYAVPFVREFLHQKIRQGTAQLPPNIVLEVLSTNEVNDNFNRYSGGGGLFGFPSSHAEAVGSRDENSKPTPDMIVDAGYPVEIHSVTTEDGYILQMHRIPYGVAPGAGPGEGTKTPIYLQHCLLCSSADWVVSGPGRALAYLLADAGFDVWLGNIRGNTYSRKHEALSPDESAFWQFSWDQHGYYDVPAQMDLISAVTGKQEMFYIGHSMGTTMFFVMSNTRPEHRDRIKAMFALAPVARVDHMLSPIAYIAPFVNELSWVLEFFGLDEFLPNDSIISVLADLFCDPGVWTASLCSNVIFLFCGFDEAQLNEELLPVMLAHTPAGSSTRTIIHYAQLVNAGRFQMYNYGRAGNLEHYGTEEPPEYFREMVTSPVLAYWSDNDWLAQPQDVAWLKSGLPNLLYDYRVPFELFNHLDYIWGIDAKELVYDDILERLIELDSQNTSFSCVS